MDSDTSMAKKLRMSLKKNDYASIFLSRTEIVQQYNNNNYKTNQS